MIPTHVAIEGRNGVGKTTLAKRLAQHLGAREILEDVENPYLADFYSGRVGAAFRCQMWFLLMRHAQLRQLQQSYRCIGEVRGRGLMIGMELIENDAERTPARALCDRLVTRGFYNGLLLLACGVSTLRFMPPLSTTIAEVDEAIGLLRNSLDEALQGKDA